jgi:ribosome maturation factor RimP
MTPVDTQRDQIWALLEPIVESHGMELIYAECLRMPSRWVVRIFLDKEGGITLDDCSLISHQAGDVLDVHDTPPGPYTLEVSSPGLDRPMFRDADFLKYRGAQIRLKTDRKIEGMKHFKGELVDYREEGGEKLLMVRVGDKTYRIPREAFTKANLEYDI